MRNVYCSDDSVAVSAFAVLILIGAASEQAFAAASLDLECNQSESNSSGECGFVGKGDVQTAFGWNNAQLQQRATGVTFVYEEEATYEVTIQFSTDQPSGEGGAICEANPDENPRNPNDDYICKITHEATQNKEASIDATVNAEPRRANQFTGFKLTSATVTTSGDEIPGVGDSCPNGNNDDCEVISVEQTSGGDSTFKAVWQGQESNSIPVSIV